MLRVWPALSSRVSPLPVLTFDELDTELSRNTFRPVYLLYGPEEYLLRKAISSLRERVVAAEARAFNYREFSGAGCNALRILEEAKTFPLMSPRRMILVTETGKLESPGLELIAEYAGRPEGKTVLALVAGELDRRTAFYRRMTERACVVEFTKVKGPALENWASNLLSRQGYHIGPEGLHKLIDLAGSDLLALNNELEKLMLYAGKDKEIRDAAVSTLIRASRQHGIFELTGALGRRDRKQALRLLGNLLEMGEPPLVIMSMMARHFRQVLAAKELMQKGHPIQEIGKQIQVPPFALQEFLRQVRSIETDCAQVLLQRLSWIDRQIKSTNPDPRMLLEHWICSL